MAPSLVIQKHNWYLSLKTGPEQRSAQLHVSQHQDLIDQRQAHTLDLVVALPDHQLFAIKSRYAVLAKQVDRSHRGTQ